MKLKRKVLRQFMLLLRNLESDEVKLKELVTVYRDGSVTGFRVEVETNEKPKLKIVKDDDEND